MSGAEAICACCQSSESVGGKDMCVNINGEHHHVLICIGCHLREIDQFVMAAARALADQQATIEKLSKPKLGVVK